MGEWIARARNGGRKRRKQEMKGRLFAGEEETNRWTRDCGKLLGAALQAIEVKA